MDDDCPGQVPALDPRPGGGYVGRIAPTPSGLLHVGHASTFSIAMKRFHDATVAVPVADSPPSSSCGGKLILRIEDIDTLRCRDKAYVAAIPDDLLWLGVRCTHGYGIAEEERRPIQITPLLELLLTPQERGLLYSDQGVSMEMGLGLGSYKQSERTPLYIRAWALLLERGAIYPCSYSRRQIDATLSSKSSQADSAATSDTTNIEPVFPPELRPAYMQSAYSPDSDKDFDAHRPAHHFDTPNETINPNVALTKDSVAWRFRVPDNETISFVDSNIGLTAFTSGKDFGDFIIWTRDGYPAYELAVVVDDSLMAITEVVRGADLLLSTARQLLLYRALGVSPPSFYHCPLVLDPKTGKKFSKRERSLSLKELRKSGASPDDYIKID